MNCCKAIGGTDDVFTDERSDTVVNCYESVAGNFFESTFYRLKTGVATGLDSDGEGEVVFCGEVFPDLYVVFGKYEYNLDL